MNATRGDIRHVYVHVPFCTRRCSYCDFSIAVRRQVPVDAFVQSLTAEARVRNAAAGVLKMDTLYFGGGTPSKLGPDGVRAMIAGLAEAGLTLAAGAEVTLEANPEDVDQAAAGQWLGAGVNRVSIGIQSFSPEVLAWMHRTHDAGQASRAIQAARAAGVANVSIDLIYALPDSLARRWSDDLDRAIELEPDHVSVYGLTIEPRTPLGRWTARGDVRPQADDMAAEEFLVADARLRAAGYEHYEVSNYARPGFRSRHNSAYWARVPYLGLGPSAHSFEGDVRRWSVPALAAWEAALARGEDPIEGQEEIRRAERAAEEAYLGLRTSDGMTVADADLDTVRRWVVEGWATLEGRHVRLTPEGWLRLDTLVGSLEPLLH